MNLRRARLSLFFALIVFIFLALPSTSAQARKPAGAPAVAAADPLDPAPLLAALKPRNIGPASMGGRTVDFAAPSGSSTVLYAAVGPSGLWKTEDAGITWAPSFHREATVSVGAVAVSPSHPDIVWIGTGEATARNSVAPGDGVYKSEDAGRTWTNMGLAETRFISRISIDPVDPDVVYVAAQGHLWGPNEERGVYRTRDGGKTWKKVLYVNPETGACDMAMDPSNSKILYAGMWEYRRWPYYFRSGGPGSGVYKTTDGGETWKKAEQGLPTGPYGRIGLGVSRSAPNVVYVLVEAEDSGLFRSDDKGLTWRRACDEATYDRVNFRPFYYSRLTVDPGNDLVVYVYSGSCYVSRDAGKTFENTFRGSHSDHHAVWVDPNNSDHVIDGNDGGIDISWNGGRTLLAVVTQPWAELYNIAFDMRDPYYVGFGLQDNGNWVGPSNTRERAGIVNADWLSTGGGDGYYAQFDPVDWWVHYRNLQMGGIERHDLKTGESQRIRPEPSVTDAPYRFNWNSPVYLSPHDRNVLYFGGNYLFKSTDRGISWVKASPDLTTNDPKKIIDSGGLTPDNTGAENHCTILTISESPLKQGLIWVGTDDGQVQVTRDGGANWENVTKNIKGFGPNDNWVTRIEASHFIEGGVYLTVSRHQVDDYQPYIFKSEDYGKTWVSLRGNLPAYGFLHTVREDLENRDLLFVGSEFGMFVSLNGGRTWTPYKTDFPTISVRDIQIHPRERDLIIATHGRGVWIVDDIRPLEKMTAETAGREAVLYEVKPATLFAYRGFSDATNVYAGPNSPFGAAVSYYLNPAAAKDARVRVAIADASGREVATLFASKEPGINRVYWNLREGASPGPSAAPRGMRGGGGFRGGMGGAAWVLPGEYKAVLDVNGKKLETKVVVRPDELQDITMEDREMARTYLRQAQDLAQKGRTLLTTLDSLSKQIDALANRTTGGAEAKIKDVKAKVDAIKDVYYVSPPGMGMYRKPILVAFRGGTIAELVQGIGGSFNSIGRPTQTSIDLMNSLKSFVEPLIAKLREVQEKDLPELNKLLAASGFPYIK
jgi:photosystem II stability/assembly factor-like uncharacterized protein